MSEYFQIEGGYPLVGEIKASGAKNAAIKQLIVSMLSEEPTLLLNVPRIGDVEITKQLCEWVGAKFIWQGKNSLLLHTPSLKHHSIPKEIGQKNRMSIMLMAPLLHRVGKAILPTPGGCKIGSRPVNFHIDAIRKMGANAEYQDGFYTISAPNKLKGAKIRLPYPSVSATENILMCASLAKGHTLLENAAMEPEVFDSIQMLQKMGAIIEVQANRRILIEGVDKLYGTEHRVLPDRLEVASYAVAALASRGDVFVKDAQQKDMLTFLNTLRRMGGNFAIYHDGIRFFYRQPLRSITIETDVYPGFATDWQQPFTLLLTQAKGVGIVHETVYENRFGYAQGLQNLGGEIHLFRKCLGDLPCRFRESSYFHSAVVRGPSTLKGTHLHIPDLRGGCSYLIAALVAEGKSTLTGIELLERGYEQIEEKFRQLGANITRLHTCPKTAAA
ncbi:MAG: UDP-N-acetylglucosamine 1-carboxyvinyltransferase [Planctomycetota bacterium]|nr:MAG: UDP-N-acetylglucosamine 1-carboxyvinyltransferase [Planctomycetota bacterium]